ncbi:MAG: hypothetical protein IKM43_02330 [Clostridia bacterium]|nr:hypothetical protein [Clostridia bacterium]
MLTLKEKYIMEYVYQKCQGKKSCLISPREIISFAADKYIIYPDELEKIMTNLSYDNYIELLKSDKKVALYIACHLKLKVKASIENLQTTSAIGFFGLAEVPFWQL